MKYSVLLFLTAALLVGLTQGICAQEPAGAKAPPAPNAQAYVKSLVKYMSNPDPRLRFSVREALRIMGTLAVSAINEAKATEKDAHVKAFMDRTVKLIKNSRRNQAQQQQGRRDFRNMRGRNREIDIDRIAMEVNLTWEQMDKTLPILKKASKDATDLFAEFREAGGNFRDREARADLQEELKTITGEAKPKLKKFLSETQIKRMERYLNPMGRMFNRGARGGGRRGGGGEGQRPGGEGQRPGGEGQRPGG